MMYISCQHDMVFGNKTRSVGAVYSATMAGTHIKSFEIGLGEPKGITVYKDDVIWVDAKRNSLEGKSITNGTKYTLKRIPELTELHDVVISDSYIYWTVLMGKAIKRSPLHNLTETETLGNANFYRVQGLEAYTGKTLNETNCSINRNVCRSICIPTPTGSQCTCTGGKFNYQRRTMRCEKYGRNRVYTQTKFCKTPFVGNGSLVNIDSFRYVPVGYRLKIRCDIGYRIKWRKIPENNRYGYTLCLSRGQWNVRAACVWALPYTVQGGRNHGYVILHKSTQFLIPPRITLVEVICIGGGGGGFDSNIGEMKHRLKAGEGHESSFGDEIISLGGAGGSLSAGGKGGIGTVYFGGDGGDANYCHYGGAAGQLTLPGTCYQPSTFCTFCGAGGRWPKCPLCSGRMIGGCTGPLSSSDGGPAGGLYGGGASGGSGGGGGGGGFSRGNVDVTPGELIPVTVGRGGEPSYAPAGDGIVVISWGGRIEQFLEDRVSESLGKNLGC